MQHINRRRRREKWNRVWALPFRSGGLCGRLLTAKLSKSLMLGACNLSASDCDVVTVKFRLIERCCRSCCWWLWWWWLWWWLSGDTLAAERNATASANRLSFVSFWWAAFCDAVKFCNNWVVLSVYSSSLTACWFGKLLLLLFSSCKSIRNDDRQH